MTRGEAREILQRLSGLGPWKEFPDEHLDAVVADIREAAKTQRTITKRDIQEIVGQYVEGVGRYKEAGEDMSDINALLMAIQNPRPTGGASPPQSGGRPGTPQRK